MLAGFGGELVQEHFAEELLAERFAGELGEVSRDKALHALRAWWRSAGSALGPASSIRTMFDLGAAPVLEVLGFEASHPRARRSGRSLTADLLAADVRLPLLVAAWGESLDRAWSDIAGEGLHLDASWVLSFNGRQIRLSDGRRTHARRHLAFEFEPCLDQPATFAVLWGLLRAQAFSGRGDGGDPRGTAPDSLIDRVTRDSAHQAVQVCGFLREGVIEALTHLLRGMARPTGAGATDGARQRHLAWTYEQAITVVYRMLFLLFAEARGLVPVWHPHYREGYTVSALCAVAERPGRAHGIWEALQAISRLAHAGCDAGSLHVTPFNGRLFAPARAPLAESRRVDDEVVRHAILALATQPGRGGRRRVAFRDLDVEQLGSVYESVLEYEPAVEPRPGTGILRRREPGAWTVGLRGQGDRRKASGTFYTPRAITDFLVRHTLAPLVRDRPPDDILCLRVLDPAMGSGAFLVAACRYLAGAYEAALIAAGACHAPDIDAADRAGFRRLVAQRCLFGVDLNPMAVQVGRLSLWLTSLAADKPLTFLDHHLVAGNSLVGASIDDLARPAGRTRPGPAARASLPLFAADGLGPSISAVLPIRDQLTAPDETVAVVREKERLLAGLSGPASALARWSAAADVWCARWFWDAADVAAPSAREVSDLAAGLVGAHASLPPHLSGPRIDHARRVARDHRFFHWTMEFPEVFFAAGGVPRADAGFDAVIGNPPWDMIRGDAPDGPHRDARRQEAHRMIRFVRESGIYTASRDGHANQYQLFVERGLRLLRAGGRLGLVVPWGLASDRGCAGLRRLLFERCRTDAVVSFENTGGIFPIHRGIRFMLITAASGGSTTEVPCLLGATDPAVLESLPDAADSSQGRAFPLRLRTDLLRRLSGPDLAIPHLRSAADLAILERMVDAHPALSSERGWGARFGRELNATDDRRLFREVGRIPVLEGKHVDPFVAHIDQAVRFVSDRANLPTAALRAAAGRPRLAYRDVASATNRLTLIAAVIPAGTVTVHTLFCLKTLLDRDEQAFLCGIFNSYVANYLVRLRVTTHVGTGIVEALPVPRPPRGSAACLAIADLSRRLDGTGEADPSTYGELQGAVARLYGLTGEEFDHVLATFPLADPEAVAAARRAR